LHSQLRTAIGTLVAPLLGGLAAYPLLGGDGACCAAIFAFAINVVVGLPVSLLFGNRTPLWHVAAAGLAVGAAPFLLVNGYFLWTEWEHVRLAASGVAFRWTAAGAVCGGVTATSFWLMVGRHFQSDSDAA
jgi:hypothetical protein